MLQQKIITVAAQLIWMETIFFFPFSDINITLILPQRSGLITAAFYFKSWFDVTALISSVSETINSSLDLFLVLPYFKICVKSFCNKYSLHLLNLEVISDHFSSS